MSYQSHVAIVLDIEPSEETPKIMANIAGVEYEYFTATEPPTSDIYGIPGHIVFYRYVLDEDGILALSDLEKTKGLLTYLAEGLQSKSFEINLQVVRF